MKDRIAIARKLLIIARSLVVVAGRKRLTTEEFVEKARKVHGDKYDYSKVDYVDSITPVTIVCPIHGKFTQIPNVHLHGSGCPDCNPSGAKKLTTEEFIEKARKVHGDKYDYSEVDYVDTNTPVTIICPIHGKFTQKPSSHLSGNGCRDCAKKNIVRTRGWTTEEFIEKARKVHGDKYDYSKVEYVNANTPVTIICPAHGEFTQRPYNHLQGHGCLDCAIERRRQPRKNNSRSEQLLRKIMDRINREMKSGRWQLRKNNPRYKLLLRKLIDQVKLEMKSEE